MINHINETLADVAALIPRYSWEIMDEEQRDDLMEKVVLPRYMKHTADGVQLGPTAWADMVGATAEAVRNRVKRLQNKTFQEEDERSRAGGLDASRVRHVRSGLREAGSEQIADLIATLPPEAVEKIAAATHEAQIAAIRQSGAEEPTFGAAEYGTMREKFAEVRGRSNIEMSDMFLALSRVRVKGPEKIIADASASERREWAERLPEERAMLQLLEDLAKTYRLEAVK